MNINQLESFSLAESARFKDHLNPTLWDRHEHLRNAVKDQILVGAEEYCRYLGLSEEQVVDIVVTGQAASYLYESTGIDVVVIAELNQDETFRELFNEHKYKYNGQHRVEVDGHLVQFYVQPAEENLVTSGSYSVLRESWVQIPVRRTLKEDSVKRLKALDLAARPKAPAPVAKKIVKERRPVVYGFGQDYLAEVEITPDGVSASTCEFANESDTEHKPSEKEIIQDFVEFCADKLDLENGVKLKLKHDPQWPVRNHTFGRYNNDHGTLEVSVGQRHIMDVLRTIAHELTHQRQHETVVVPPDAGDDGSEFENEANASAGVLMRLYGKEHPELFSFVDLKESSGYIPTEAEKNDPRFEMALSVDVHPGAIGQAANAFLLNTDAQGHPQPMRTDGIVERMFEEYQRYKK